MSDYSLSDLWREIKSENPGVELASILDAATVMARTLLPGADVVLSGMKVSRTDRSTIYLSAEPLGNSFPVPGDNVDNFRDNFCIWG